MVFHICFSNALIWMNQYPGEEFATCVIKKCICLIIFIDCSINHATCSIHQKFVVAVVQDKSAECLPLGTSEGNEIWICHELKSCKNSCCLRSGIASHQRESCILTINLMVGSCFNFMDNVTFP